MWRTARAATPDLLSHLLVNLRARRWRLPELHSSGQPRGHICASPRLHQTMAERAAYMMVVARTAAAVAIYVR